MEHSKEYILDSVNIPEFHISLKPSPSLIFEEELNDLYTKYTAILKRLDLTNNNLLFAKIFIADYINCENELRSHNSFKAILNSNCPVSIIEQPPLDGSKINMLLYFIKSDKINKEQKDDAYYCNINGLTHIYQNVISFPESINSIYEQTEYAFNKHIGLLEKNNLTLKDNCVRTWIYSRDVDKDYSHIVKARNDVFQRENLTTSTHFIASTGIEGKGVHPESSVNIDFYSIKGLDKDKVQYLQALEHLNNTSEYGVAFERGTSISYPDKKHIFISGTASIDKYGECLYRNDVLKQAERLFLNIKMLLANTNAEMKHIAQMIIYLRNVSDYEVIFKYIKHQFPQTPFVIVSGRVCRPEWLMEVECIASLKTLDLTCSFGADSGTIS